MKSCKKISLDKLRSWVHTKPKALIWAARTRDLAGLFFSEWRDGVERNLSFQFHYDDDPTCPELLHVTPNPSMISDTELMLTTTTCIQALATKHGLEQALTMVSDAAYGRLANGTQFDTRWLVNK